MLVSIINIEFSMNEVLHLFINFFFFLVSYLEVIYIYIYIYD